MVGVFTVVFFYGFDKDFEFLRGHGDHAEAGSGNAQARTYKYYDGGCI